MEKIKYLMSLTAENRLIAGMMFIIVFMSGGWGLTAYNYSKYRDRKENQLNDLQRTQALETIGFYNRLIDGQTKRADKLDSILLENQKLIQTLKK